MHSTDKSELVFESSHANNAVPHFNAMIYYNNGSNLVNVGQIEDVFGTISNVVCLHIRNMHLFVVFSVCFFVCVFFFLVCFINQEKLASNSMCKDFGCISLCKDNQFRRQIVLVFCLLFICMHEKKLNRHIKSINPFFF